MLLYSHTDPKYLNARQHLKQYFTAEKWLGFIILIMFFPVSHDRSREATSET
jgi:hypothetical protein